MAPLSIRFLRDTKHLPGLEHAALVAFHGSWNRTRKQGYQVVSLHWDADGRISVAPFLIGFERNGDVIGRPVDTSVGPDGAIYVSDDYAGVIYRISYGAAAAAKPTTRPAALDATPPAAVDEDEIARGKKLFETAGCANCHGGGKPAVPLKNLSARYKTEDLAALLTAPPANMPPFPQLKDVEKRDIAAYVLATHK
jgi:mono/diheme cytochrome c family protein